MSVPEVFHSCISVRSLGELFQCPDFPSVNIKLLIFGQLGWGVEHIEPFGDSLVFICGNVSEGLAELRLLCAVKHECLCFLDKMFYVLNELVTLLEEYDAFFWCIMCQHDRVDELHGQLLRNLKPLPPFFCKLHLFLFVNNIFWSIWGDRPIPLNPGGGDGGEGWEPRGRGIWGRWRIVMKAVKRGGELCIDLLSSCFLPLPCLSFLMLVFLPVAQ